MSDGTILAYRYDGTFDGFLTCVYESYLHKEIPSMVLGPAQMQSLLFAPREIETDADIARRVAQALAGKVSADFAAFVERAFLTNLPGKEVAMLRLCRMGLRSGAGVLDDLANDTVSKLTKAVLCLGHEAHLFTGFVRFQDAGGALVAQIEPKNRVLPLMASHFADRFASETILIYDKTHREALVAQNRRARVVPLEALEVDPPDETERRFRALFRKFYQTIAIRERTNPVCQRGHMPLRYRGQMPEQQSGQDVAFALPPAVSQ